MRTHTICKSDLTEYAIKSLGLWDALTGGRAAFEVEVEVLVMRDKNGKIIRL
jgi:hypothetical protein